MSKYKVGDKVILTVSDVNEKAYYPYYMFNNNNSNLWISSTDKYSEPLSTYTEPLEAEITRLLRENKELKEQMKFDLPTLISEEDRRRMDINKARAEGTEAAWELARKIFNMEVKDIEDIFIETGAWNLGTVLDNNTYPEAATKVAEWEKAKEEIKVGDEVEKNDLRDARFIVTFTNGKLMSGVTQSGLVFANEKLKEWHKTGRHIDIDSFLKQIRGEGNEK